MTQTPIQTPTSPALSSRDLNLAAGATRVLLDGVLARAGADFPDWIALRGLALSGPATDPRAWRDDLAAQLDLTTTSVDRTLQRLAARGWTHTDGTAVELTTQGSTVYQRIADEVAEVSADIYRDIDPADLAATQRVLVEVYRRATARRSD